MDFFIWTGFTLGIFGSLHCLGMCGPLVLAIPIISKTKFGIALDGIIYNLGRTLTYTFMGFLLGVLGVSVKFAGIQDYVSITLGVLLLLSLVVPRKYYKSLDSKKSINKIVINIKKQFKSLIETRSRFSLLFIGVLNGFLPCGLVYAALAGSLAMNDLASSSLYMFAFGLGTIPMLATVYFTKNLFTPKLRANLNKLIPYTIAVVAVILILRGLNLGIPYISPTPQSLEITNSGACCH
ncbi:MAG TPA: sulfite exporter TauE/SafE family protein [Candidatus Kapabacteria bacterium]|nr:sulfite exporter TauE/SafE family protein [Candidatus Kapabacteria bacterium]